MLSTCTGNISFDQIILRHEFRLLLFFLLLSLFKHFIHTIEKTSPKRLFRERNIHLLPANTRYSSYCLSMQQYHKVGRKSRLTQYQPAPLFALVCSVSQPRSPQIPDILPAYMLCVAFPPIRQEMNHPHD